MKRLYAVLLLGVALPMSAMEKGENEGKGNNAASDDSLLANLDIATNQKKLNRRAASCSNMDITGLDLLSPARKNSSNKSNLKKSEDDNFYEKRNDAERDTFSKEISSKSNNLTTELQNQREARAVQDLNNVEKSGPFQGEFPTLQKGVQNITLSTSDRSIAGLNGSSDSDVISSSDTSLLGSSSGLDKSFSDNNPESKEGKKVTFNELRNVVGKILNNPSESSKLQESSSWVVTGLSPLSPARKSDGEGVKDEEKSDSVYIKDLTALLQDSKDEQGSDSQKSTLEKQGSQRELVENPLQGSVEDIADLNSEQIATLKSGSSNKNQAEVTDTVRLLSSSSSSSSSSEESSSFHGGWTSSSSDETPSESEIKTNEQKGNNNSSITTVSDGASNFPFLTHSEQNGFNETKNELLKWSKSDVTGEQQTTQSLVSSSGQSKVEGNDDDDSSSTVTTTITKVTTSSVSSPITSTTTTISLSSPSSSSSTSNQSSRSSTILQHDEQHKTHWWTWTMPKHPWLTVLAPTSLASIIMGGYLTRRHIQRQRALGKPTIFDRMWKKSKKMVLAMQATIGIS